MPRHLFVFIILITLTLAVKADVIFDTLGSSNSYILPGFGLGQLCPTCPVIAQGDSFSPSGQDYVLTKIELAVSLLSGPNDLTVMVMTDAGGVPDQVLESFHFSNAMGPQGLGNPPLTAPSVVHPVLKNGATYWLVGTASSDTFASWHVNSLAYVGPTHARRNGTDPWALDTRMTAGAFRITGTPVSTCTDATLDRSLSFGVVDASLEATGSPCTFIVHLRNKKNYWTNIILTTQGGATATPVGGDLNQYANYHILPPSGFLSPSSDVAFTVQFFRVGDFFSVFADPTVQSGSAAAIMNAVQAILNVLPGGGLPTLLISDHQKIVTAFTKMPHLNNAATAFFTNPPQLTTCFSELGRFTTSEVEVAVFGQLLMDLEVNIGVSVLKAAGSIPWRLLNALVTIFGQLWTAAFQYPAGSIAVVAK